MTFCKPDFIIIKSNYFQNAQKGQCFLDDFEAVVREIYVRVAFAKCHFEVSEFKIVLLGTKYFGRHSSVTSKQINVNQVNSDDNFKLLTFLLSKMWHLPPFKNLESSPLFLGDCPWAKLPCGNLFNFSS
jgi:hypothetical protein